MPALRSSLAMAPSLPLRDRLRTPRRSGAHVADGGVKQIVDGLQYEKFRWRDSDCYLLQVDLEKRSVRPIPAAPAFPFQGRQPALDAIAQGAWACIAGGFNITQWNLSADGVMDQPQHSLVLNREIWTTGIGSGGYGFLMGDGWATTQKNRVEVVIWRPDGTTFEVGSINLGHSERVVAFTPRGGTNDVPMERKHYVTLGNAGPWVDEGAAIRRSMDVLAVDMLTPPIVRPHTVVLEARWPLKLKVDDEVRWVQHLGAPWVERICSGWPEILHAGENVVHGLLGVPSHGPDNWLILSNPRGAVGTSEDGKTAYLLTVQGRVPNEFRPHDHSKGLRLKEMGTLLRERGAYYAVNMDGGGSAFMWIRDGGPDHGGTLVAPGCYNGPGTLEAGRPAHFSVACF